MLTTGWDARCPPKPGDRMAAVGNRDVAAFAEGRQLVLTLVTR